jgi:hypothetical protein
LWYLAGGRGEPPTAGNYRAWRARDRERISEENVRMGREGKKKRGFFREILLVLFGAKVDCQYKKGKKKAAEEGEESAEGEGAAGEGGGEGSAAGEAAAAGWISILYLKGIIIELSMVLLLWSHVCNRSAHEVAKLP